MTPCPDLSVQLLSRPGLLAPVRSMVVSLAERTGFDEVMCSHIQLAVDEALANVLRHGYGGREDCRIWVHLWELHDPAGLRIVIEDLARQVDPETIRGRELDEVRPGGLGVHLMQSLMDVVRFERRHEGGMRLTLEKILRDEPAESPV
ncbi:MAG: ATP-binding protein [Phycisphaeraceae bacterium]|nr:ATP-binding protein [Phycisphaeraceae bacterium]